MNVKQYTIGDLTMQFVFKPSGMTNISDLQKVFDKTEEAFAKLEPKFGELTNAQRERLEMLAEEAAEVVQCCTKILRHGLYSVDDSTGVRYDNRKNLEKELMDVWSVYERMAFWHDVGRLRFNDSGERWATKLEYTHHQPDRRPANHPPKKGE